MRLGVASFRHLAMFGDLAHAGHDTFGSEHPAGLIAFKRLDMAAVVVPPSRPTRLLERGATVLIDRGEDSVHRLIPARRPG